MIKCNVCQVEKEDNNFQKYWHSSQNKMRIRKQCTECFYQIRLKRTNSNKIYENDPNYKKCTKCEEWKTLDEYYVKDGNKVFSRCKECERIKERAERKRYRDKELIETCGGDKMLGKPNQYTNEYQRDCTFNLMENFGYTYDKETGTWLKPGVKEIIDNKIVFPKVVAKRKQIIEQIKEHNGKKPDVNVTPEKFEKLFELRLTGYTYQEIAHQLDLSVTTVYKWINGQRLPKWKNTLK